VLKKPFEICWKSVSF